MKIGRIIHQQIFQLRWHFLACLGLMMVLPLEEAIVNFKDGAGFYSISSILVILSLAPLLAGLIACANVQADLEDRQYLFWRSKPVRTWIFILLKFFTGMGIALVLFAVPFLFIWISSTICQSDVQMVDKELWGFVFIYCLVPIMPYSICFFCNVLVRKTARAWLIGMAATGFILLVPFVLPINIRTLVNNKYPIWLFIYPVVAAVAAITALVLSLWAAGRNWHQQANLKGLLWAGAGILFALMLFFGRQIANIKVLDEKVTSDPYLRCLNPIPGGILMDIYYEIRTTDNKIHLNNYPIRSYQESRSQWMTMPPGERKDENLKLSLLYPSSPWPSCYHQIGDSLYAFGIFAYVLEEKKPDKNRPDRFYKKLYMRSFQFQEGSYTPVSTVEVSDLLDEEECPACGMRIIEDKLIVLINRSCVVAEVTNGGELVILQTYKDYIRTDRRMELDRRREFSIPLVPVEQIGMEQRIKLSIDWNHWRYEFSGIGRMFNNTITDRNDDTIYFYVLSEVSYKQYELSRYEVIRRDDQNIYCRFVNSRPFTFLERLFGNMYDHLGSFVHDGKLYFYTYQKLMVFDIRSQRIRKLGHFERVSHYFDIKDVAVLEDGNILMSAVTGGHEHIDGQVVWRGSLYLLENPE